MKALILDLRICEVRDQEFPVAPPLRWVDCANDVTPETHTFDGASFLLIPPPPVKTLDERAAEDVDRKDRLLFEINFDQENRLRAVELKPTITRLQYRDALIARWKALNS